MTALFLATPTGRCRVALRRFGYRETGAGVCGHDATVVILEDAEASPVGADGYQHGSINEVAHDDPRWPQACSRCGAAFTSAQTGWQTNELDWYEGGGHRFSLGIGDWEAPVGAVIPAPWMEHLPDNGCPSVRITLPDRERSDGLSTNVWLSRQQASLRRPSGSGELGPQWAISGSLPGITVTPSIDSPKWHGWIQGGVLTTAG